MQIDINWWTFPAVLEVLDALAAIGVIRKVAPTAPRKSRVRREHGKYYEEFFTKIPISSDLSGRELHTEFIMFLANKPGVRGWKPTLGTLQKAKNRHYNASL